MGLIDPLAPPVLPLPLAVAHVRQFGNFYLRIYPVCGGNRLVVNITHFPVPVTDLQLL